MSIDLPLDQMTVAQKLEAMEAIWTSLCGKPSDVPSPAWHEKVLAERKQLLDSDETSVSDWSDVKRRLQNLGQ